MRITAVEMRAPSGMHTLYPIVFDEPEVYSMADDIAMLEGVARPIEYDETAWYEEQECECCGTSKWVLVAGKAWWD